jgi:hypothetical protein
MKINFKQFGLAFLLITSIYLVNPLAVKAQDVFCDKLLEKAEQVEKQITQRQDQIIEKQTEGDYTLEVNRQQKAKERNGSKPEWIIIKI